MKNEVIVKSLLAPELKIKNIQPEKVFEPMVDIVLRACAETSQNLSIEDVKFLAASLDADIRKDFPAFTLQEISHVIHRGVRGFYSEFTGISVANIYKWLKQYSTSDERAEYIRLSRDINQKQLPQQTELTDHEKRERMISYTVSSFTRLKEKGHFNDVGNAVYDFLDQNNIIKLSNEKKKELFEDARQIIKKEKLTAKEAAQSTITRLGISKYLQAIETAKKGTEIAVLAKKIALNNFFQGLIEMDMDIREYIDERINN